MTGNSFEALVTTYILETLYNKKVNDLIHRNNIKVWDNPRIKNLSKQCLYDFSSTTARVSVKQKV